MDQFKEIQNSNQKIINKIVIVGSFLFVVLFGSSVFLIAIQAEKTISLEDAQKIGNWEFPDSDYNLKKATKEIIYGITLETVEIKDEKSGNDISILHMPTGFESKYMIKNYGSTTGENLDYDFLERYIDDNYNEKSFETIILGNQEAYYSMIETESYKLLEKKVEGLVGTLRCGEVDGSIVFLIVNSPRKYDNQRALEFLQTANCTDYVVEKKDESSLVTESNNKTSNIVEEATEIKLRKEDSDNDGLSDLVEMTINTDKNNPDTDFDGYTDFDEIKNGYNPLSKSLGDKYPSGNYINLKNEIKIVDEENYNEIFNEE
ncbi:MAG: thrombospondin type 3 repeat-containing protein [Patescibacteria group bacterium]|nr:thrombospondin type 3 repeat-containing protein [Patescibacteria group bacterium]